MPGRFPPTLRPQRHRSHSRVPNDSYDNRRAFDSTDTATNEKSSLDLTQRLEKKLADYNASDNVLKRWILEVTSWAVSAICLGAVVGIYDHINGRSMVQSERLLTWVNVLGKIASAALIVPTSEALGQLKWNWFHKSRAMWDFEIFDKASRGPWGAIMLLFRTKGRSLAALGALLILLLLAIDTFLQQVVDYPDHWAVQNVTSSIPRVINYEPLYTREFLHHEEQGTPDRQLGPVIKEYFYGNGTQPIPFGNGTRPDIPLICPASTCDWPIYDTLGVCSQCVDVSLTLEITLACINTTIDWSANWTGPITDEPYPNGTVCGHFLNATSDMPTLLSGYIVTEEGNITTTGEALMMRIVPLTDFDTKQPLYSDGSISFKNIRYPLVDSLIASIPTGREGVYRHDAPVVHECILSWCVQTIKSSYELGVYSENITSTYLDTSSEPTPWPWEVYTVETGQNLIYAPNITLQPSSSHDNVTNNKVFGASNLTVWNVMAVFDDFFPSSYTAEDKSAPPLLRYKNYFNGPSTRYMEFNPWLAPNNLTRHMERLATSMTNVIRSSISKEMLHGDAYAVEKYVLVRWAWLIFPFALLILSLAFLVSTIIKTSKDTAIGVWKTSAMPTLIYGLPENARDKLAGSSTWNSSHEDTKKVKIRLLPDLGWRLSGQSLLKSSLLPVKKDEPPPEWI